MRKELISLLACPRCGADLGLEDEKLSCTKCNSIFSIHDGIIDFLEKKPEQNKSSEKLFNKKELKKRWLDYFSEEEKKALKEEWNWMIEQLHLESNLHLDWGTGTGRFLRKILSSSELRNIVALEGNQNTCEELKDFLQKLNIYKKVSIICADANKMPFKDNSFGSISSWCGLDEPDILSAIEESKRVLKESGIFVASGTHYEEDSESFKTAKEENIYFVNERRAKSYFRKLNFNNFEYQTFYRGKWKTKQSFLPKPGDYYTRFAIAACK